MSASDEAGRILYRQSLHSRLLTNSDILDETLPEELVSSHHSQIFFNYNISIVILIKWQKTFPLSSMSFTTVRTDVCVASDTENESRNREREKEKERGKERPKGRHVQESPKLSPLSSLRALSEILWERGRRAKTPRRPAKNYPVHSARTKCIRVLSCSFEFRDLTLGRCLRRYWTFHADTPTTTTSTTTTTTPNADVGRARVSTMTDDS